MVEGPQNPHLSWRELVCLGQEKLLEPEGVSGSSGESVVRLAAQGGDGGSHSPDGQLPPKAERTPKDRWPPSQGDPPPFLLLAQCPQPLTPLSHLLILVHHAFATGVKKAEGAQDGFFGVCPWEAKGGR